VGRRSGLGWKGEKMGRARSEVKERESAGPQEEWAGGLGWERGLGFFFFSFSNPF
jgi:hypothetical protein